MALSYVTYAGTGVATNFSVPFGYINQSDVSVYLDGVLKAETTDYVWFNSTTIQFLSAPGLDVVILFQRDTQNTDRIIDFQDAGNLTEFQLDTSAKQVFYLTQESIDDFNDLSLKLTGLLTWDAQNHRIVNVLDPVDAQDAVTLNYLTTTYTSVVQAIADAAQASADAAAASAVAAAASEAAAATSESNAYIYQGWAYDNLQDCIVNAGYCSARVTYAAEWATKAEDSLISVAAGGDGVSDYSALHWAAKAEGWAASLNFPSMSGQALKFLRADSGETGWEYYDIFGGTNTFTGVNTFSARPYFNAGAAVRGWTDPTAGAGPEIGYTGGVSVMQSYDRDTAAWKQLTLRGTPVVLDVEGTQVASAYLDSGASAFKISGSSAIAKCIINAGAGTNSILSLIENGAARCTLTHDATANQVVMTKWRESDGAALCQLYLNDDTTMRLYCPSNATSFWVQDSIWKLDGASAVSGFINAGSGTNAHLWFQEGGNNQAIMYHDAAGNALNVIKYNDTDHATADSVLTLASGGACTLSNNVSSTAVQCLSTGVTLSGQVRSNNSTNTWFSSGDLQLADYGASGISYLTAGYYGVSTTVLMKIRTMYATALNDAVILEANAATLHTYANSYSFKGEYQMSYAGFVYTSGAAARLPSGWSSAQSGTTGYFVVTHNLGHANYTVVVCPNNSGGGDVTAILSTMSSTQFTVQTKLAGVDTYVGFNFIMQLWQ